MAIPLTVVVAFPDGDGEVVVEAPEEEDFRWYIGELTLVGWLVVVVGQIVQRSLAGDCDHGKDAVVVVVAAVPLVMVLLLGMSCSQFLPTSAAAFLEFAGAEKAPAFSAVRWRRSLDCSVPPVLCFENSQVYFGQHFLPKEREDNHHQREPTLLLHLSRYYLNHLGHHHHHLYHHRRRRPQRPTPKAQHQPTLAVN